MKKMFLALVFAVLFAFGGNAFLFAGTPIKSEPHQRDPYNWAERHADVMAQNKKRSPKYIFFGDSIVHHWGGEPKSRHPSGRTQSENAWRKIFDGNAVTNAGFGFDYIDNAYYRVEAGELDGIRPRAILILLGTNNLFHLKDRPNVCVEKMKQFLKLVRKKQPRAKILLIGVLPRREAHSPAIIEATNEGYRSLADNRNVFYLDAGTALLSSDGKHADARYMRDNVHPNAQGYERLAELIEPKLKQIAK